MKKIIAFIFVALICCNVYGVERTAFEVVLYFNNGSPIDSKSTLKPRSTFYYPHVISENDVIKITADRRIENAQITITTSNGTVVASAVSSLSETAIYIQIPDFVENESYKIEIAYDDIYLYGYIKS